jgi:hypothetical protein
MQHRFCFTAQSCRVSPFSRHQEVSLPLAPACHGTCTVVVNAASVPVQMAMIFIGNVSGDSDDRGTLVCISPRGLWNSTHIEPVTGCAPRNSGYRRADRRESLPLTADRYRGRIRFTALMLFILRRRSSEDAKDLQSSTLPSYPEPTGEVQIEQDPRQVSTIPRSVGNIPMSYHSHNRFLEISL